MKKINLVIFKTIKLNRTVERKIKKGTLFPASIIPRLNIKLTIKKIKNLFLNFIFLKNLKIKNEKIKNNEKRAM